MFLTPELLKFVDNSAVLSGNIVFITDLEKILYSTIDNKINENISCKVLQTLLSFSRTCGKGYFINSINNDIVPIYEKMYLNTTWTSQIILPIYIDDSTYGTLIVVSCSKKFSNRHLQFARTIQDTIIEEILKSLNEEWEEK